MQSPTDDPMTSKSVGRLLGPALGDQQQGNFSINLWKHAFQEALKRLCPVRAGIHECGCLPVLARRVSILQCFYFSFCCIFTTLLSPGVSDAGDQGKLHSTLALPFYLYLFKANCDKF